MLEYVEFLPYLSHNFEKSLFYYTIMWQSRTWWITSKQCRLWSYTAFCLLWSWSKLCAQTSLSEYLGSIRYDIQHGKKALMPHASSEGPDQHSHPSSWSGHSLFFDIYYNILWICKRATKVLISLRKCAGWSGLALFANCIGARFLRCASYINLPRMNYLIFREK